MYFCKYFSWKFLAQLGCGKFHPMKAPMKIQKVVSNIFPPNYNSG